MISYDKQVGLMRLCCELPRGTSGMEILGNERGVNLK